MAQKQLSNPYSTAGGGIHFENRVQAAFTVLMLARGYSPCLKNWPIEKIKLQGKYEGYDTDDLIVICKEPNSEREAKLLGQVKHSIKFTKADKILSDVIQAAWNDFNNKVIFSEEAGDAIALICGPLSATDIESVRPLLEQARISINADEFIRKIELAKFTSNEQREKLEVIKEHLNNANSGNQLTNEVLWRFLRIFHVLIYDLDIKGVVLSLLHSIIAQYTNNDVNALWTKILDHVAWVSERAGYVTISNMPEEISSIFHMPVQSIPDEFVDDNISKTDWNNHPNATELATACLIGSWTENSEGDIEIITKFIKTDYKSWISKIREILQHNESPLMFKNGVWNIKDRKLLWQELGTRIFDDHLDRFREVAVDALTEIDPKFELPKEEHFSAAIKGKILNHSPQIRRGFAEGLALLGNYSTFLKNCTRNKPQETALLVIRKIFDSGDWQIWTSLNDLLPLLAEAAPEEFINTVEHEIVKVPSPFIRIFELEGTGVIGSNYMTGLLWALETLAWEDQYIVPVSVLLGHLANIDPGGNWMNRPSNSLSTIFLPWLPQTTADFEKRQVAIQTLYNETPDITWNLLLNLLPNQRQISLGTHKPAYRNSIPTEWTEKVSQAEYKLQIEYYAKFLIEKTKDNIRDRLEKLIKNIDKLPKQGFEELLNLLSSGIELTESEETNTNIWNKLLSFTSKHKKYHDTKWALDSDNIEKIQAISKKFEPIKLNQLYARLFIRRDAELYEERGNWNAQHQKLENKRKEAVAAIYREGGIEAVVDFSRNVESSSTLGRALGKIEETSLDDILLPKYLELGDNETNSLLMAFVRQRLQLNGWNWVDKLINQNWSQTQFAKLFTFLPFTLETWKRVDVLLSNVDSLYWKNVTVNPYESQCNLEVAINKLIENERPFAALNCIHKEIEDGKPMDALNAIKALFSALESKEELNAIDEYQITEIIKKLQDEEKTNLEEMIKLEWYYLHLLDIPYEVRPKYIFGHMANNPSFFCDIIQRAYRSINQKKPIELSEQDKKNAAKSWELLYKWNLPPGLAEDGTLIEDNLKKWFDEVVEKCKKSGHLEIALTKIGEVLYYSPVDPDGLWINKSVAELLNRIDMKELRDGFSTEIYSSRGAHWIDPTGQPEMNLAADLERKAEETENAGYHRLAATLRNTAKSYEEDAERIIEEHNSPDTM